MHSWVRPNLLQRQYFNKGYLSFMSLEITGINEEKIKWVIH
jgi:hypothetical protein